MATGTLIIRADASLAIGTGHVMRCLALAQAWQDAGGDAVFAMAQATPGVEERLRAEGMEVIPVAAASSGSAQDALQLSEFARTHHAPWLLVDGYQFDAEYQRSLKDAGLRLLFVDDTGHAGTYLADIILNQNAHASEDLYGSREARTRLLLGPRFAMLRREFEPWRAWKREVAPLGRKVLVTMGGTDPDNVTALVIEAIRLVGIKKLETAVVVGSGNPHIESLEQAASRSVLPLSLLRNAPNMPELMAWADVAVSAAGSTCWEMCYLGLPALLIDVAANQAPVARALDQKGVAVHLGSPKDIVPELVARKLRWLLGSEETRAAMSSRARELVDGRGAQRVVCAMRGTGLRLRRAEEGDCRLLWEWANDPEVRAASFSSAPIPWEEHLGWFTKKLQDRGSPVFIATDEHGAPIGQIRLDRTHEREADVDVSVARQRRRTGYARFLIENAAQAAFRETDLVRLHAFIKPTNQASVKAFEESGFRRVGSVRVKGNAAIHYVRERGGQG